MTAGQLGRLSLCLKVLMATTPKKRDFVFVLIAVLCFSAPLVGVFLSLFVGRYPISLSNTINVLATPLHLNSFQPSPEMQTLILDVRLPRALSAGFVGMALAITGAAFQTVFRNPLTDSGLLGVTNGAGFGAAFAILFFGGGLTIYPSAFLFGILAVALCYLVARVYRSAPTIMLILAGVVVSSVFSSLLSILKIVADPADQLPTIVYWLMGSLGSASFDSFWALIPIALGVAVLLLYSWRIDALAMGDKEARSLGIDVRLEKLILIAAATLATAGAVCIAGSIGWVGLVIPHIARMLVGNKGTRLLPISMALGATYLILVDLVSRTMWSSEVPLGILTALIGAPFFVYLLKKTKGGGW